MSAHTKLDDNFNPGSFGFHELLDRSYFMAEVFSNHISEHPAATHPKLIKKIAKIETALFHLYQRIADLHGQS